MNRPQLNENKMFINNLTKPNSYENGSNLSNNNYSDERTISKLFPNRTSVYDKRMRTGFRQHRLGMTHSLTLCLFKNSKTSYI